MQKGVPILKYKLHHVTFWALVFAFWYYLRYQDYESSFIALQITLLKVVDLAGMIYLTNYFLIPRFLYRKKYAVFVLLFFLMILMSSVIKVVAVGFILQQPDIFNVMADLKTKLYENAISDFFLVSAGAAFKLIFDYLKMQQKLAQVAKEKAETELNFLKSQINPHFLFNSLNSVYFLINKDNSEARDALHKFSEMLRYQLYEANGDKIPLEREIHYLKDYIELQQLRKEEKRYSIQFNIPENLKGLMIEPLLLIPFVENAFKHLSHFSNTVNFIKLDIDFMDQSLSFRIENSREVGIWANEKSGGIGLGNVKRRLELLYPGKHRLDIDESGDTYSVSLKIQLNGN